MSELLPPSDAWEFNRQGTIFLVRRYPDGLVAILDWEENLIVTHLPPCDQYPEGAIIDKDIDGFPVLIEPGLSLAEHESIDTALAS